MGITGPYRKLTKHMPTGSLVSVAVLTSVLGSVVIQLSFDLVIYHWMTKEPWYKPYIFSKTDVVSFEATVLFLFTSIQYLVTSIAFSISKPFRDPLYKNPYFTVCLIILTLYSYYIILIPDKGSMSVFALKGGMSFEFKSWMAIVATINAVFTYLYEKVIAWSVAVWWKNRRERKKNEKIDIEHRNDMIAVAAQMSNLNSPDMSMNAKRINMTASHSVEDVRKYGEEDQVQWKRAKDDHT